MDLPAKCYIVRGGGPLIFLRATLPVCPFSMHSTGTCQRQTQRPNWNQRQSSGGHSRRKPQDSGPWMSSAPSPDTVSDVGWHTVWNPQNRESVLQSPPSRSRGFSSQNFLQHGLAWWQLGVEQPGVCQDVYFSAIEGLTPGTQCNTLLLHTTVFSNLKLIYFRKQFIYAVWWANIKNYWKQLPFSSLWVYI